MGVCLLCDTLSAVSLRWSLCFVYSLWVCVYYVVHCLLSVYGGHSVVVYSLWVCVYYVVHCLLSVYGGHSVVVNSLWVCVYYVVHCLVVWFVVSIIWWLKKRLLVALL